MASAEQVRELRARTGAGIMECKKALQEADGELEKAIDVLRKQGTVKAAKKAGRSTKEGRIDIAISGDGSKAAIVEVNCETDFVARNDDFQAFVKQLAEHALTSSGNDLDAFLQSSLSGKTVQETLQDLISVVGENMGIARVDVCDRTEDGEILGQYIHAGNQIGVIVKIKGSNVGDDVVRDVAMHIAAMHPLYTNSDDVPADVAEKERDVLRSSPDMAGKPEEVVEKMIAGRFRKFLSQICLVEQAFIKDPQGKQTVGSYLESLDSGARVVDFVRFQVGERAES